VCNLLLCVVSVVHVLRALILEHRNVRNDVSRGRVHGKSRVGRDGCDNRLRASDYDHLLLCSVHSVGHIRKGRVTIGGRTTAKAIEK